VTIPPDPSSSDPFAPEPTPSAPPAPVASNLPAADWYPDPENSDQLRYWDGERWTDHRAPRVTGLRSLGDWLSAAFSTAWKRIKSVAWLWMVLQLPIAVLLSIVAAWAVRPIRITGFQEGDFDVVGLSASRLAIAGILTVVSMVLYGAYVNALRHQMFHTHRGRDIAWGASAVEGLGRVPRWIGWGLLFFVVLSLAMAVVIGLSVAAIAAGVEGTLLLIIPVGIAFFIFVAPRLYFVFSSIAVGPRGSNPVSTSWDLVRGNYWPVLGRVLLWAIISGVIGSIFNTVVSQFTTGAFIGAIDDLDFVDVAGGDGVDIQLDGRSLDSIGLDTFFSGPTVALGLLAVSVFGALVQAITQALNASADTNMYLDLDGPFAEVADAG